MVVLITLFREHCKMPTIRYNIDDHLLNINRELYIKNRIKNDESQIIQNLTFWEFLESFFYADIIISELNNRKSISIRGGLLSFFFQLYSLLSEFERNKKNSGFILGCEQGDFNLEIKKDKTELIIISQDKTYSCNFLSLFNEVKRGYNRIIQFELNKLKFIREDYCFKEFIDKFQQN